MSHNARISNMNNSKLKIKKVLFSY